ncbi:MAG TPA: MXAN_6640 family putative metalloprotease [Bacteroidota bacterium]|nr:MXAN_6640 family putative metalloprotease [Bacteroidota bacterium]
MKSTTKILLVGILLVLRVTACDARSPVQGSRSESYRILRQFMEGAGAARSHEKCDFPLMTYALRNRGRLNVVQSAALVQLLARPSTQKSVLIGEFRIHYDTTGDAAPAMLDSLHNKIPGTADQYADSVGAIANFCEMVETKILGYLPSPLDSVQGGPAEYDIYIDNLNDYGATTPVAPITPKTDGSTYTSFITVDNAFQFVTPDSERGLPALRVTLAHELHHSIQIGNYGYWTNDQYFYELTSVWMEDVVFPQVKDYMQYFRSEDGQFTHPEIAFNTSSFIMYSRALWGHYIAKRFGRDAMLRTWEEIRNGPPLPAIDAALSQAPYNSSLRSAFVEWCTWNYFTGGRSDTAAFYPEGDQYPQVNPFPLEFVPPSTTFGGSLQEFSSTYYSVNSGSPSVPVLVANANVAAGYVVDRTPFPDAPEYFSYPFTFAVSDVPPATSSLQAGAGLYVSFNAPDAENWYATVLVGGFQYSSPFPDPFKPDGNHRICFPVNSASAVQGTLSIFSSTMKLLYSRTSSSLLSPVAKEQVFEWDGIIDGKGLVSSGVYFYVVNTSGGIAKGKFAVLR